MKTLLLTIFLLSSICFCFGQKLYPVIYIHPKKDKSTMLKYSVFENKKDTLSPKFIISEVYYKINEKWYAYYESGEIKEVGDGFVKVKWERRNKRLRIRHITGSVFYYERYEKCGQWIRYSVEGNIEKQYDYLKGTKEINMIGKPKRRHYYDY